MAPLVTALEGLRCRQEPHACRSGHLGTGAGEARAPRCTAPLPPLKGRHYRAPVPAYISDHLGTGSSELGALRRAAPPLAIGWGGGEGRKGGLAATGEDRGGSGCD